MIDNDKLAQKAIKKALDGHWDQAVEFNLQILSSEPESIAALLRLAKAYTNLNKINQARRYYRKVLSLDKYNPIAKRNLSRLKKIKDGGLTRDKATFTTIFLEEPGKTKSVYLVRLTDEEKLATLEVGEPVNLLFNPRSISVCKNGKYLGRLTDDLAFRLLHLTKRGNLYEAFIRSVDKDKLQIFIKETKKSKRNQQIPSFPSKTDKEEYHTFLPVEMLGKKEPLIMGEGEGEE